MLKNITASLAKGEQEMNIEQLKLFHELISKTIEFKEVEEKLQASLNLKTDVDSQISHALRDTRLILSNQNHPLSGREAVLLESFLKLKDGHEHLDTRQINISLDSYGRKPSNASTIIDQLEKQGLMKIESNGLHSHKTFQLTPEGEETASEILSRYAESSEYLSVIG